MKTTPVWCVLHFAMKLFAGGVCPEVPRLMYTHHNEIHIDSLEVQSSHCVSGFQTVGLRGKTSLK